MLSLLLAIISASFMYLVFKFAGKKNLAVFPIILTNYATCVILSAFIWKGRFQEYFEITSPPVFVITTITGFCFIGAFFLMAVATKSIGVATSTTISRMSMVFPTLFTIIVFHDPFNYYNIAGFLLAFLVIYFIIVKGTEKKVDEDSQHLDIHRLAIVDNEMTQKKENNILLLLFLFIGFGVCDILNKSITRIYFDYHFHPLVMFFIYSAAFLIAILVYTFQVLKNRKNENFRFKPLSIPAGIFLGMVNLSALYFFLKALTDKTLTAPAVFSINSIGILVFSTIISMIFFKEEINKWKWIGIGLALVSIILLNIKDSIK